MITVVSVCLREASLIDFSHVFVPPSKRFCQFCWKWRWTNRLDVFQFSGLCTLAGWSRAKNLYTYPQSCSIPPPKSFCRHIDSGCFACTLVPRFTPSGYLFHVVFFTRLCIVWTVSASIKIKYVRERLVYVVEIYLNLKGITG